MELLGNSNLFSGSGSGDDDDDDDDVDLFGTLTSDTALMQLIAGSGPDLLESCFWGGMSTTTAVLTSGPVFISAVPESGPDFLGLNNEAPG